jgi:septum formation protein
LFFKGLILASTSPYRRALLERLRLPFECIAPHTDESPIAGELPAQTALRLARLKAEAVATRHPDCVVIGSDQLALRGHEVLGKPGTVERCRQQLQQSSGQEVQFLTAVHLIDGPQRRTESHVDRTTVRFRELSDAEIDRYIKVDNALERIESEDPTGLTGLPLVWVCGALRRAGISAP